MISPIDKVNKILVKVEKSTHGILYETFIGKGAS